MSVLTLPDLNLLSPDALRALIVTQHEQLLSREREIEHLKLLLAKLHRMQFGRKSEKLARQIEQLELRLEELQSQPVVSTSRPEEQLPAISFSANHAVIRCPSICPVKRKPMNGRNRRVRIVAASCVSWEKTSPRCWNTSRPVSR